MKTISQTKRCVFDIQATTESYTKIDCKLPDDVEYVTGVCFSIASTIKFSGIVSLRFSEGGSSPLLLQRVGADYFNKKKTKYIPMKEPVSFNALIQGYYKDSSGFAPMNYIMKIYIEYVPYVND